MLGEVDEDEGFVQVRERPLPGGGGPVLRDAGDRRFDVLRLPAVPPGGTTQRRAARLAISLPWSVRSRCRKQVDAGGGAGGGQVDRFGTAAEVSALVSYLAGPDAAYITGSSLNIDGGFGA